MPADAAPFEDVIFTSDGVIATMRLNRPAKLNALTLAMHDALMDGVRRFRRDPALRVLILTGRWRATPRRIGLLHVGSPSLGARRRHAPEEGPWVRGSPR